MNKLPLWAPTTGRPAFYDSESATAIEMVAKLYGAMQSLIDEYNNTIEELNKQFTDLEGDTREDLKRFKEEYIRIMNNFNTRLNTVYEQQQKEIQNAIQYMTENLNEAMQEIINEQFQNGSLKLNVAYDSDDEELSLTATM